MEALTREGAAANAGKEARATALPEGAPLQEGILLTRPPATGRAAKAGGPREGRLVKAAIAAPPEARLGKADTVGQRAKAAATVNQEARQGKAVTIKGPERRVKAEDTATVDPGRAAAIRRGAMAEAVAGATSSAGRSRDTPAATRASNRKVRLLLMIVARRIQTSARDS